MSLSKILNDFQLWYVLALMVKYNTTDKKVAMQTFNSTDTIAGAVAGGLGGVQTSGDVLAALPYTYTVG